MSELVLAVGSFDDLDSRTAYLLWQLRESVFVVEQDCAYPELDGRDLEDSARHVWAADDALPVGYLRVLSEPDGSARLGRVVVAPSHRGSGLADALMEQGLQLVGDRRCEIHAQSYLARWYARHGFTPCGEEFLDDGILHTPMRRG